MNTASAHGLLTTASTRGLLTTQEVAEALSVSKSKVRLLIADGTLPTVRIGKALRFTADDVNALIESARR